MADRIGKKRAAELRRSAKFRAKALKDARRRFALRQVTPPAWVITSLTRALRVAERREKKRKAA